MKTLLQSAIAEHSINRIQALEPKSQPKWEKMNVVQMLAHCRAGFEMYFGERKVRRALIGILFGKMANRKLLLKSHGQAVYQQQKNYL